MSNAIVLFEAKISSDVQYIGEEENIPSTDDIEKALHDDLYNVVFEGTHAHCDDIGVEIQSFNVSVKKVKQF